MILVFIQTLRAFIQQSYVEKKVKELTRVVNFIYFFPFPCYLYFVTLFFSLLDLKYIFKKKS